MTTKVVQVQAYSKKHAQRVAAALEGVSLCRVGNPVKAKGSIREGKTCKTDDHPVKGTRKWVTQYEIFTYGHRIALGRDKWEYIGYETVKSNIETKTEALSIAKSMAVKHQMPMGVKIVQNLVSHDPSCADVLPNSNLCTWQVRIDETQT